MEQENLGDCIKKLSAGVEKILKSGLNQEAIIVLLHDKTKVSKKTIKNVLGALKTLEMDYCSGKN